MWAARIVHEAQLHGRNSFVTLTYADDKLPASGGLVPAHLQKFWKRLRKRGNKIRYYAVGEYGDQTLRPHYHACVFGYWPADCKVLRKEPYFLFSSDELADIWGFGHVTVAEVTYETAAYCARYVLKKITGEKADEHYERISDSGEIFRVLPEYSVMSRRPGIGFGWFEKYASDVYPDDFVVVRNGKRKTPRYYDQLLDRTDPEMLLRTQSRRLLYARARREEFTDERLRVKEVCMKSRLSVKKRESV